MSTITATSPSLPRPYIGSRRNRSYINNKLAAPLSASSSIPSAYSFSTVSSSLASRAEQRGYLSNSDVADTLQAQQEEQTSTKYLLSSNSFDERQQHQSQEKKAKGSLPLPLLPSSSPSTTSSSSVFSFPPLHKPPRLSDNEHTSLPFVKEQNKFHHLPHHEQEYSDWQPLNQNNQLLLEEKLEQEEEEEEDGSGGGDEELRVRKHQPSSIPALFIRPPNFDLSDVPEENNSFSSSYSLSDTPGENNTNGNRYPLLTSTPTLPSFPTTHRTTSDKPFSLFLSVNNNNNNNIKSLPLTFDSRADRSSTISTVGLIADLQRKADACELNNMSSSLSSSSLRYSSNLGASTCTSQPYDQRISDQGDKYIIQLKTDEYQENEFTIAPRYSSHQLVIDAKYREEDSAGGYVHRELHKIFNIPQHIDLARHMHSYNKQTQELTIEMPYLQTNSSASSTHPSRISPIRNPAELSTFSYGNRNRASVDSTHTSGLGTTATDSTLMRSSNPAVAPLFDTSLTTSKPFDFDLFHRSAFRPQIVRAASNHDPNDPGEKKLVMSLDLSDYQAEDIKVSIKDRELIVQAERKIETDTRKSRTSFYQSTSLPPQTDIEHLQSNYIDGKLVIEAPYLEQTHPDRRVQSVTSSHSNQAGAKW